MSNQEETPRADPVHGGRITLFCQATMSDWYLICYWKTTGKGEKWSLATEAKKRTRANVFLKMNKDFFLDCLSSVNFFCPFLNVLTGRKRKWFKVDEAIRVLQNHKPVHAEYLRRLSDTCSPTNGNAPSSQVMGNNAPHYVVCSTMDSDLINR